MSQPSAGASQFVIPVIHEGEDSVVCYQPVVELDDDGDMQGIEENGPTPKKEVEDDNKGYNQEDAEDDEEIEEGVKRIHLEGGEEEEEEDKVVVEEEDDAEEEEEEEEEAAQDSFRETERFRVWKKHVKDLYQQCFHIETVWPTKCVQLMPYMMQREGTDAGTQTLLCGTRTWGAEQNYVQLFSMAQPRSSNAAHQMFMDHSVGEVGGFDGAPDFVNFRIERRMFHEGDVLCARYMYANPLVLATSSSNHKVYIFDWSRNSLQKAPNKDPRPRGPMPPCQLGEDATPEQRKEFKSRMATIKETSKKQEEWDRRTGKSQEEMCLNGNRGEGVALEWNTSTDGSVACGSEGKVCVWSIGGLAKDCEREQNPNIEFDWGVETERLVTDLKWGWGKTNENNLTVAFSTGDVHQLDVREDPEKQVSRNASIVLPRGVEASSVSLSPLQDYSTAIGGSDGHLYLYDTRVTSSSVSSSSSPSWYHRSEEPLHAAELTRVEWSPHSSPILVTGSDDGTCTLYDTHRKKLLFRHYAHTTAIQDLCWSWQDCFAGQVVSCDSDAITMWKPRTQFWA